MDGSMCFSRRHSLQFFEHIVFFTSSTLFFVLFPSSVSVEDEGRDDSMSFTSGVAGYLDIVIQYLYNTEYINNGLVRFLDQT